jgi:glycosyltransferase involved in cell wall biosynthesis
VNPKVSINLCCYNGEAFLAETLDSICAQTYSHWELVIINDGSTDATEAIVTRYQNREVPIVYHYQQNQGLGAARNKALELSSGALIAFIDQDDVWLPEKLEKQIRLFENPEIGLVYCDAIFFNDSGQCKRLYKKTPFGTGHCFDMLLENYFLSLPTVMLRKTAIHGLDYGFDPRFNMIEEADLFRRIGYTWKLALVNEPLARWRVHQASWTYTKYNRIFEETDLMLEAYSRLFPDFPDNYRTSINRLRIRTAIDAALSNVRNYRKPEARAVIRPYRWMNRKAFLIFLLTLLPMKIIALLYTLKGKIGLSSPLSPPNAA